MNLTDTFKLTINIEPPGAGEVNVNSINVENAQWQGIYFTDFETQLKATGKQSYEFSHWEAIPGSGSELSFISDKDTTFTAVFVPVSDYDELIINEINYNSSDDFNPKDWVEFYNPKNYSFELSDWIFKDENDNHQFVFPEGYEIEANDFVVICKDTTAFHNLFPDVENYIGNFNFGLSGEGELIRVFNPNGVLIDQVPYDNEASWPVEPAGNGQTLALINTEYDNYLPESWAASFGHGSPGEDNGNVYLEKTGKLNLCKIAAAPNPMINSSKITVQYEENISDGIFIVFDQTGKEVIRINNINSNTWNLDVSNLKSGFYFAEFMLTKQNISVGLKLIVK